MAVEVRVPEAGESISEVEVAEWVKAEGEDVRRDDVVAIIETEKASLEVTAPASGVIKKVLKGPGQAAKPGEVIGYIEEEANGKKAEAPPGAQSEDAEEKRGVEGKEGEAQRRSPAQKPRVKLESKKDAKRDIRPDGGDGEAPGKGPPGADGRDQRTAEEAEAKLPAPARAADQPESEAGREEKIVPMSLLRRQIAERLVRAQAAAALLTTFNEIDMSAVIEVRKSHHDAFQEIHGVKLGFMSFFVKAAVEALKRFPALNAEVRGTDIVYRGYYDIGIAIGSGKGLVVPVLRNAERMNFAEIERAIGDFSERAQKNALKVEELRGGTFSITNGGIYGSLMSTPIVNPPQSGILGLHAIQERPVAVNKEILIRPMMYVALTYDHRVVDGREAVTFLRSIKEMIERPVRIMLRI